MGLIWPIVRVSPTPELATTGPEGARRHAAKTVPDMDRHVPRPWQKGASCIRHIGETGTDKAGETRKVSSERGRRPGVQGHV